MVTGDMSEHNNNMMVPRPTEFGEFGPATAGQESAVSAADLLRFWPTILIVTVIAAIATLGAVWGLVDAKYQVMAAVRIVPIERPILTSDQGTDISRQYRDFVATEAETMIGPALLAEALDSPELRQMSWVKDTGDPVGQLLTQLEVKHVKGTQLLRLSMVGQGPEQMAITLNTILRTYLHRAESKQRSWDDKVLSSLRAEQSELEAKLTAKAVQLRQVATDNQIGTASDTGSPMDARIALLQQLHTEARQRRAVAQAKLKALSTDNIADAATLADPAGFERFLTDDPQSRTLHEQIRATNLEALSDERLGRGPHHPDVRNRSTLLEALTQLLTDRTKELRQVFAASLRHLLQSELMDSQITAQVLDEELQELIRHRGESAGHKFMFEDLLHAREQYEQALAQVRQKIWNVELEQNRASRISIDALAQAPNAPNIDKRPKFSAVAIVFSLFMGCGAAMLRNRLDHSFHLPMQVSQRLGVRVLGSVENLGNNGVEAHSDDPRITEPMRGISTALLTAPSEHSSHSRLITGPTPGSGKSSLAFNLAKSLAATGRRVLLVDADNQGRGVTERLGMGSKPGLAELLNSGAAPDDLIRQLDETCLSFLPAGKQTNNFGELLIQQQAQKKIRELFRSFDEIIVDSPPVLTKSDAVILATLVDEVILVLRAGKSTHEEAESAKRYLGTVGSNIVGVILNAVDPKLSRQGYGYSYGYGYHGSYQYVGPNAADET